MHHDYDLATVWAFILAFVVFAYVVMDGFDLGIGIIYPTLKRKIERDLAMSSIAPVWDGNETWLVLGGVGLMGAFPLAYAIILSATYPLVIAMLLGLVLRGVAFEFRWRSPGDRTLWDTAFWGGSVIAAMAQGMLLGAILQGIHVDHRAYAGARFDWFTPFSLLTGISVVAGYALLGASWLIGKTDGALRTHARSLARRLGLISIAALGAVSAATPFLSFGYWHRWFELPGILFTAPVPLLVILGAAAFFRSLDRGHGRHPFLIALGLFVLGFVGLGISVFPYIIPESITVWQAAAPERSQTFLLVGTSVIIPVIVAYTSWAYWVFRGQAVLGDDH